MQYSFHVLNIQYKISKGTDKIKLKLVIKFTDYNSFELPLHLVRPHHCPSLSLYI